MSVGGWVGGYVCVARNGGGEGGVFWLLLFFYVGYIVDLPVAVLVAG